MLVPLFNLGRRTHSKALGLEAEADGFEPDGREVQKLKYNGWYALEKLTPKDAD